MDVRREVVAGQADLVTWRFALVLMVGLGLDLVAVVGLVVLVTLADFDAWRCILYRCGLGDVGVLLSVGVLLFGGFVGSALVRVSYPILEPQL